MSINKEQFSKIFPKSNIETWYEPMAKELSTYNKMQQACFLATIFIETNGLQATEENLNYSEQGLLKVFPNYFKIRNPKEYARNPQKIANLVYGNRMGNGDEASGDGYKYRGRGIIQLTGKNNYTKFGKIVGADIVNNPSLILKDPLISVKIAIAFFTETKCWGYAEKGDIKSVSGIVNAGSPNAKTIHGLNERMVKYNEILTLLNS